MLCNVFFVGHLYFITELMIVETVTDMSLVCFPLSRVLCVCVCVCLWHGGGN